MNNLPEAQGVLGMHPPDLGISTDKLVLFLCVQLGDPKFIQGIHEDIQTALSHDFIQMLWGRSRGG